VDPVTAHQVKLSLRNAYKVQLLLGLPVSLLFMGLVVGCQVALQYSNYRLDDTNAKKHEDLKDLEPEESQLPTYAKYVPSLVNAALIVLFGAIYKWLSRKLVILENHQYEQSLEDSLINKTYMFNFVNTYISFFVAILYNQNFWTLATNLIIVMVFKQLLMNVLEYFQALILVGRKLRKVDELFKGEIEKATIKGDKVALAELKMHCNIQKQLFMSPDEGTLVYYYNEAIIQLGFIAFFTTAFPLAPLFSFLTNLLEIKIKLN